MSINIQRGQIAGKNPEDTGAVSGAVALPYRMKARRIEFVPLLPCDIWVGYWRSDGESDNTFAVESAIDELALLAGADPMAFRKGTVDGAGGDSRALGVLAAVETLSNWASPRRHCARRRAHERLWQLYRHGGRGRVNHRGQAAGPQDVLLD